MPTSKVIAKLRDSVFLGLNAVPAIRDYLTEARIKPQPRYKKGFLYVGSSRQSKALAGMMLPQPEVKISQGKKMLLDNILGQGFALLRLNHNPDKAFASLNDEVWKRLNVSCISIDNEFESLPANLRDLFILVRPDRYIYGVFKEEQAGMFASAFLKHLRAL